MGPLAARLAVALMATIVALAGAEGLLRLTGTGAPRLISPLRILGARMGIDISRPDDDLLMRLEPNTTILGYYHTNSRGWRGPEVADRAADGVLRIVCVGDSCTFGYGLKEQDTWPAVLQQMLDTAFEGVQRFEVINTGVTGYSTWQNRLQIEGDVAALDPDMVLILPSGHNDITGARRFSDRVATEFNHSLRKRLENTALYRSLDQLAGASPEDNRQVLPPGVPGIPWRVPPAEVEQNLRAMVASCEQQGAELVFIAPAHRNDVLETIPAYRASADSVERVAATTGTPLADPREQIAAHEPDALFIDPVHPDADGAAWIAFACLRTLASHPGLLPESPRRSFLENWLDAREQGLAAEARRSALLKSLREGSAPPDVRAAFLWIEAHASAGMRSAANEAASADGIPDAVRRFDPLLGTEADPYGETLERYRDGFDDEAAAQRADECKAFVVPGDPLAALLSGLDLEAPPADAVTLARTLSIMERLLGLPARRYDIRLGDALEATMAANPPKPGSASSASSNSIPILLEATP